MVWFSLYISSINFMNMCICKSYRCISVHQYFHGCGSRP